MCSILREVLAEGRLEGIQEGMQKGLLEGKREGLLEGKREGLLEGKREGLLEGKNEERVIIIKKIMLKNNCSINDAMEFIDIPEEEREEYVKLVLG